MSGISFFGVSSPFWALIGGVVVSLVLEQKDFYNERKRISNEKGKVIKRAVPGA